MKAILRNEDIMQQEINCVDCASFRPLAPHEDGISLPDEANRGLCLRSDDRRPVFFGNMTCPDATPAYREHPRE